MALRTVEQRKKVLHTTYKHKRKISSPVGNAPPGESPTERNGEMTDSSGRFFIHENQNDDPREPDFSVRMPENRSETTSKPGKSGKILHTVARTGMDAVNNNVEGGEELKEAEQILMAVGAVGRKAYRFQKEKTMVRKKSEMAGNGMGVSSNRSIGSGSAMSSGSSGTVGTGSAKGTTGSTPLRSGEMSTNRKRTELKQNSGKKSGQNRKKSRRLREKYGRYGKRRYYGHYRRRQKKHDEDDNDEEPTPIGIRERLIHAFRVRDAKEDSADTLGSVTKGTKGLKRVIKIILFLIKKLITLLFLPFIIIIVVLVILIALIVGILLLIIYCSPLSIFFPLPDTATDDIRIVLSRYYQEFNAKVSSYESNGMTVTYQNSKDGVITVNFKDTLMVYLTLYADGAPGFIMDDQGRANLKKVFDEMNYIDEGRTERQVKVGDSIGKVFVTAYCPCRECSGPHGHATASGKKAKEGQTVAVDAYDPIVPMGTKVVIDGHVYTVEDTGDLHKYGNEFDIFYEKHEDTGKWGRRKVEVFLADKDGKAPENSEDNGTDNVEPDDKGNSDDSGGNTVTVHLFRWLSSCIQQLDYLAELDQTLIVFIDVNQYVARNFIIGYRGHLSYEAEVRLIGLSRSQDTDRCEVNAVDIAGSLVENVSLMS